MSIILETKDIPLDLLEYFEPINETKKDVWRVTTKPYSEAHFATFPPDLVEPCILAGCPQQVCKKCGKARVRIVEKSGGSTGKSWHNHNNDLGAGMSQTGKDELEKLGGEYKVQTTGWTDCGCGAGFRAGIVADIFIGSGTVAEVAVKTRRDYVGCELNPKYIKLGRVEAVESGVPIAERKHGQKGLFDKDVG